MKFSRPLQIVVAVLIFSAFYLGWEMGKKSHEDSNTHITQLEKANGDKSNKATNLDDEKKSTKKTQQAKNKSPKKTKKIDLGNAALNKDSGKLRKTKIKRVNFDKYEYEVVHYKAHNPYKEDLSEEANKAGTKNYGKYKKYSSIREEINGELESMSN